MHLTRSSKANFASVTSVFGTVFAVVTAFVVPESRVVALGAAVALAATGVFFLSRQYFRRVHVVHSVRETLDELRAVVMKAEQSVWTARTQLGAPDLEQPYFDALLSRVLDADRPLEDFRRIILLNASAGTRRHIHWLIDKFADIPSVHVRYYVGGGPPFDFMTCDQKTAVLGLPKAGSESFANAVFFSRTDIVIGMRDAFNLLWKSSTHLFTGKADVTSTERAELKSRVDTAIEALRVSGASEAG